MQLRYHACAWANSTWSRTDFCSPASTGSCETPDIDAAPSHDSPASAAIVGAMSADEDSADVDVPGSVIPGARTTSGTCMISWYANGPLFTRPWAPHMSPWSLVKTIVVSSHAPTS